jgi:hypothetical protein
MAESSLTKAIALVLTLLGDGPTDDPTIEQNCDLILSMLIARGESPPDRVLLIKEIQSKVTVWQEQSVSLDDRTDHVDWLPGATSTVDWHFWNRYRRYLETVQTLPPTVIGRLDESTSRVLGKLEAPNRPGPWDRRGLVVGHVQSGKTGHYSGLVCKAADSGYKLIVVMAGVHNSLRSQTQLRLDEAFLGIDTQFGQRSDTAETKAFGAGAMLGAERLKAASLTTSHESGDFKRNIAQNAQIPIGDMPILLVVKKHTSILRNLYTWLKDMHGLPPWEGSDERLIPDIPFLLIDDEADNASINVRDARDGSDPTATNKEIRLLLNLFEKSAYVGYTATPFANIFSSPEESEKFGLDVFPRSFIESLKAPSNYFGPVRVFGLGEVSDDDYVEALPITRDVADFASWMPDKHKKDWVPEPELPATLRHAIGAFVLACAARRARGQINVHNSMLIHVTRFQLVQQRVSSLVDEYVQYLKYRVKYGDGDGSDVWDELEAIWHEDFATTTGRWPSAVDTLTWEDVRPEIVPSVEKLDLRTLNGSSQDSLEYYEHREHGLNVIAIGGNKLSRGLTLEGLTVSYYLRASRMYDTLMQMGRWFGYRPGYEDLCRLYTTSDLMDWYREITLASEELRGEFEFMAQRGATPEEYGLRVRTSPAGLSVTSPSKMRSAKKVTLTFSADIVQTVTFDITPVARERNKSAFEQLVAGARTTVGDPLTTVPHFNGYVWNGVDGRLVAEAFFDRYVAENKARRVRPEFISQYIKDSMRVGELKEWTVGIFNKSVGVKAEVDWSGLRIALTTRAPLESLEDVRARKRMTIRGILSPDHEFIDMGASELETALRESNGSSGVVKGARPTGRAVRELRPASRGLLLIYLLDPEVKDLSENDVQPVTDPLVGFAVSFPKSDNHSSVTYAVNEIWSLLAYEELTEDKDDD